MITLTNDMEVGVPAIDAQHRELVNRLNSVLSLGAKAVSREETLKTLDFLGEYVVKHFSDEEDLQKQALYAKYVWHKEQHELFIGEFKKLKAEFDANGVSVKFTLDLNKSIIDWVVRHIKSADTEFGRYYRQIVSKAS